MCFPVKCSTCSLTTWGGCGKHVPSVYQQVPKGQACMCRAWPGVEFPKAEPAEEAPKTETKETASAATVAES